jgi:hypothetical protein
MHPSNLYDPQLGVVLGVVLNIVHIHLRNMSRVRLGSVCVNALADLVMYVCEPEAKPFDK